MNEEMNICSEFEFLEKNVNVVPECSWIVV